MPITVQQGFFWILPALLLFSRAIADATVMLVGIAFLIRSHRQQSWQWLNYRWFQLALIFWAYLILVNTPLSSMPLDTVKYALTFIRWPLFAAALAYWLLTNNQHKKIFLLSLMITSGFVVLDTAWQYLFGIDWFGIEQARYDRLTGPFRNPVPGTLMLRVWFVVAFAVLLWQTTRIHTITILPTLPILIFVGFAYTFITGERMALMLFSMMAVLVIVALLYEADEHRKRLTSMLILALMLLIVLIVSFPYTTERSLISVLEKLEHFVRSDYGKVFNAAREVWQAHFWVGAGLHTYQPVCEEMGVLAATKLSCTHPHNLYLELGAETGLVGLMLYLAMLVGVYWTALKVPLKAKAWLHAAFSAAILTVTFWPLTGGISVFNNWIAALVWLGVGWVLAVSATPLPIPFRQKAHSSY